MRIKRKVLIIIFVLFIVLSLLLLLWSFLSEKKNYPEQPIRMNNLGTSSLEIDITTINIEESRDLPLYTVKRMFNEDLIE